MHENAEAHTKYTEVVKASNDGKDKSSRLKNSFKQAGKIFTWKYYKEGFSGWTKPSKYLWIIGMLFQLVTGFAPGFNLLTFASTIAGIIGFTTTVAITNGKAINGFTGFVSALLLIVVARATGNYSDMIMQVGYIILLDIPIIFSVSWGDFKPRKSTIKDWFGFLLIFLVLFGILFALDIYLQSPQAFLDAFSAAIGFTGAVLCVRRFSMQYVFWSLQGVLSVLLWLQTAINGHAVWVLMFTYILYLANDLVAFLWSPWFKKIKK